TLCADHTPDIERMFGLCGVDTHSGVAAVERQGRGGGASGGCRAKITPQLIARPVARRPYYRLRVLVTIEAQQAVEAHRRRDLQAVIGRFSKSLVRHVER